jgi:hypothetical protein
MNRSSPVPARTLPSMAGSTATCAGSLDCIIGGYPVSIHLHGNLLAILLYGGYRFLRRRWTGRLEGGRAMKSADPSMLAEMGA